MENPEWSANSKTIHAWTLWLVKGRRWGMKSLCGVRTPQDFPWGIDVTSEDALAVAKNYYPHLSVCGKCEDRVSAL